MRNTTSDKPRGIQWTPLSHLEDLDFVDNLAVLSSREHLQEKADRLNKHARQTDLNINTSKTQVMCINSINPAPITVNSEPLDYVEDFAYLGSLISTDNGAKTDIQTRLSKARGAFARLQNFWRYRHYNVRNKFRLYNSNAKSVQLYSLECWRVVKGDMDKISAFHNGCLRKICHIFWPNKVSNKEQYCKIGCNSMIHEIKCWQLRWLGHTLRVDQGRIPKVATDTKQLKAS